MLAEMFDYSVDHASGTLQCPVHTADTYTYIASLPAFCPPDIACRLYLWHRQAAPTLGVQSQTISRGMLAATTLPLP